MRSLGRVVPPLAARRSLTDEFFIKEHHRERGQFVAFLFGIFNYCRGSREIRLKNTMNRFQYDKYFVSEQTEIRNSPEPLGKGLFRGKWSWKPQIKDTTFIRNSARNCIYRVWFLSEICRNVQDLWTWTDQVASSSSWDGYIISSDRRASETQKG